MSETTIPKEVTDPPPNGFGHVPIQDLPLAALRPSQNAANGEAGSRPRPAHRLERLTFTTSRELDFFTEKTLIAQTGYERSQWPLVIVKELIDNALDAAEDADTPPVVEVIADEAGIAVRDNGPGLPGPTLQGAMDFTVRVSSREAYVSPCRGAQGNALKTLIPMPWVVDREHGKVIVTAHGKRHVITCGIDTISQRVVIHDDADEVTCAGTEVRLQWRPRMCTGPRAAAWPFAEWHALSESFDENFRLLVEGFALFNPHAEVRLEWFGERTTWPATVPGWAKWKPGHPTSAHWYDRQRFERLIGAYVTHDRDAGRDRLVSELLADFDGLKGSARRTKVLDAAGMKRAKLSDLVAGHHLDPEKVAALLAAMQDATRPVTSKRLGMLGEEHLKARLLAMGALKESFQYKRILSRDGLPGVLETAFGVFESGLSRRGDATGRRKIFAGANWSAAIRNPFRSFGSTGEGLERMLAEMRVSSREPAVFVIHLAQPRLDYTDAGKSALVMGGDPDAPPRK
jgi:hypothetical protein